jgi:hypothetical protein
MRSFLTTKRFLRPTLELAGSEVDYNTYHLKKKKKKKKVDNRGNV